MFFGYVGLPSLFLHIFEGGRYFVCVLFGFVIGVNSVPCPVKMVCVGYCYMDSGSLSQHVRLGSHEFPESS